MTTIKIALVDDHTMFRKGLKGLLEDNEDMQVSLEAANGQDFLEQLADAEVDLVLLDLDMPVLDGIETLARLKTDHPDLKVIILSMHQDEPMILHLMKSGAHGYLIKESEPEEVELAIRSVMESGFYFNDNVSRIMLAGLVKKQVVKPKLRGGVELTRREMEVLREVALGLTNAEIADKLFLSPRTVEGHRKNILEKTGTRNTAAMIIFAIKQDWINPDEL
jgi:DNA-binding NarL/FixJ family response regulator